MSLTCLARARVINNSPVGAERHARQNNVRARIPALAHRSVPFILSLSLLLLARLPRKRQVIPLTYFEAGSSQGGTSEKTRENHVNWNP